MLQYYWMIITITVLAWASYEDFKHRLIPDKIWLIMIIFALPGYIYWFNQEATSEYKIVSIINILLSIFISFTLFFFGSFGGGDSKALIMLSLTTPVTKTKFELELLNLQPFPSIFVILILLLIFFILFALSLLIRNILEISKYGKLFEYTEGSFFDKTNTLLSCRRVSSSQLSKLHHSDPAEIYALGKWSLYAPIFQAPIEDEEAEKKEREMRNQAIIDANKTNREYLWTRPQPPGLIFVTMAYISWLFIGSPISPFY